VNGGESKAARTSSASAGSRGSLAIFSATQWVRGPTPEKPPYGYPCGRRRTRDRPRGLRRATLIVEVGRGAGSTEPVGEALRPSGSYTDSPRMSPNLGPAGLRGARFQAVFARSRSAGIGWSLWGFLPHFLPQRTRLASTSRPGDDFRSSRQAAAPGSLGLPNLPLDSVRGVGRRTEGSQLRFVFAHDQSGDRRVEGIFGPGGPLEKVSRLLGKVLE